MSDYLLPPVIENALIVLMELPEDSDKLAAAPGFAFLKSIAGLDSATVYVFIRPAEALEPLDDLWPESMDCFALAAQVEETQGAAWHGAVRRVFSRATVRRAIILDQPTAAVSAGIIQDCFVALESGDVLLANRNGTLIAGFTSYDPDFFYEAPADAIGLMKRIGGIAAVKGLRIVETAGVEE